MGDILAFVSRVRESAEWTGAERARLEALADGFIARGVNVQVVYGATDAGDPWCVVMDENDEVLVHVARIGGRFIVHSAADDVFDEGGDLPGALSQRMAMVAEDRDDVVVPFSLASRQAQGFLALLVATAFFYETREVFPIDGGHGAENLPAGDVPTPLAPLSEDDGGVRHERELAASGATLSDPSAAPAPATTAANPAPEPKAAAAIQPDAPGEAPVAAASPPAAAAAPAPAEVHAAPAEALHVLVGSAGDDLLVGSFRAERIEGEAGADTLQGGGAPTGHLDTLDGGAGDDRIEMTSQVVATGGEGADTFVIVAPVTLGHAQTLLGTVTDFRLLEGDRLVDARNAPVVVVTTPPPPTSTEGFTASLKPDPPADDDRSGPTDSVYVDLDGDGHADGHLNFTAHAPVEAVGADDTVVVITGASLHAYVELF